MKRPDFVAALKEADRELQRAPIPLAVSARLERRLLQRTPQSRARAGYWWAWAAAATCATALVIVFARAYVTDPRGAVGGSHVAWLQVRQSSADLATRVDRERKTVVVERGSCTLTDNGLGMEMKSLGPLELRREPGATRIVRGRVAVRVQPRTGLTPVRLLVSHGTIDVIGTHFTVIQDDQHGEVSLHEGKIRFRSTAGTTVELTAGQNLGWPLPERADGEQADAGHIDPEPSNPGNLAVAPDAGRHAAATPTAAATAPGTSRASVVERLEQIQGLRSRGQWARAAAELSDLLREPLPAATRERLSYELGSIETYQIHDAARACAVWRSYQMAYPQGRYRTEVERAQRSLSCGDPKH